MPRGITRTDWWSLTRAEAITAPRAMPKATTPWRIEARERSNPRLCRAHSMTMNCSVAPAPQNSVVTASEIWPSLSAHRRRKQAKKSFSVSTGLAGSFLSGTPVFGTYRLKNAAIA